MTDRTKRRLRMHGVRSSLRPQSGLLGSMLLLAVVIILMTLVALGLDSAHLVSIRAQLRNAADAAAVAGAQDLASNFSQCNTNAYAVAAANLADGVPLSNSSAGVQVVSTAVPPTGPGTGTVTVNIKMLGKDLLTPILGRYHDAITVTAVAGPAGKLKTSYANTLFPIAVSLDKQPPGDISLLQAATTTRIFNIYLNATHDKNGAFTTFTRSPADANWIQSAIAQDLNVTGPGGKYKSVTIPSVTVGVDYMNLNDGIDGGKDLASDPFYSDLLSGRTFLLPVITGDSPYNKSRLLVGFVAVQFTAVLKNPKSGDVEQLTCKIVDTALPGISGTLSSTGNSTWDTAINSLDPSVVKLLQ